MLFMMHVVIMNMVKIVKVLIMNYVLDGYKSLPSILSPDSVAWNVSRLYPQLKSN